MAWEAPFYQGYDYMAGPPQPRYLHPQHEPVVLPAVRPRGWGRNRVAGDEFARAPMIYHTPGGGMMQPGANIMRSQSTGHRRPAAAPQPVVINNVIPQDEAPARGRAHPEEYYLYPPGPQHGRRASSSRERSPHYWKNEAETDQLRKELEDLKREKERKAAEERIKKDMEVQVALREMKKRDDEEKAKKIGEQAILDFQRKEAEEREQKRLEKEKSEKDYRERLQRDLGLSETQIAKIVKNDSENAVDLRRTTYTKIARRHVSIDTLRTFGLPFKLDDREPDLYVLIKRWVPEYEQEQLWDHTRRIRELRELRVRRVELKRASEEAKAAKLVLARRKEQRAKSPGLFGFLAGR